MAPSFRYARRYGAPNRIKEIQLHVLADRASAATMRAKRLRLWFASMAYVLLCALRRIGLAHIRFARATCATIRLTLLQDRSPGARQRPPRQVRHALDLPIPGRVRCRPPAAIRRHGVSGSIEPRHQQQRTAPYLPNCHAAGANPHLGYSRHANQPKSRSCNHSTAIV
jgi:hypothetical protein